MTVGPNCIMLFHLKNIIITFVVDMPIGNFGDVK